MKKLVFIICLFCLLPSCSLTKNLKDSPIMTTKVSINDIITLIEKVKDNTSRDIPCIKTKEEIIICVEK